MPSKSLGTPLMGQPAQRIAALTANGVGTGGCKGPGERRQDTYVSRCGECGFARSTEARKQNRGWRLTYTRTMRLA